MPAAGVGSRLGDLTKHYNKALLPIGRRPVISHIIDWYPNDAEFVVALGAHGEQLREYLEVAYPNRKIEFVIVDKYEGPGSGLGYTLKQCRDYIDQPFFFHANDTVLKDDVDFQSYKENTVFVCKKDVDSKKYRTVALKDNNKTVKKIYDKTEDVISEEIFNYVGVAYISDYLGFRDHLDNISIEIGESDFFMKQGNVNATVVSDWYDIGSVEQYRQTLQKLSDFENLAKHDESIFFIKDKVIKFFTNEDIVKKRVLRAHELEGYVPQIESSKKFFYTYNHIPGALLSEVVRPDKYFPDFLRWCKQGIWAPIVLSSSENVSFQSECMKFYYLKTLERLDLFYALHDHSDSEEIINGQDVPKLKEILEKVDWISIKEGTPVLFHGDLHFENILINDSGFVLIDWRQGFGNEIKYGDIYYDLAKLYHGLIVNHSIIRNDLFNVVKEGVRIDYDFNRKSSLLDCVGYLKQFVYENGYSWKKVEVLTSLIFLNIAALHHQPYSYLLYYLGKSMLHNTLKGKG